MVLDLIRTNAALCQMQREKTTVDGTLCVTATEEDFRQAARLFASLNGENGGQGNKLTKRETGLMHAIAALGLEEVTITRLQKVTGWTNSTISKLLHGYQSYGKSYSGLLDKCPAVSYLDRTVTKGDEGYTTLRRAKAYLWDAALYQAWVKGGSVWLAPDPEKENPDPTDPPDASDALDEGGFTAPTPPGDDPGTGGDTGDGGAVSTKAPHEISSTVERSPPRSSDQGEPPGTGGEPSDPGVSLASITPQEFFRVDGLPDRRHCSVCGKRPTQYQERMTIKRMQDPPRSNLMLCVSCYNRAVSRAAASIIPLPGMIDTTAMVRQGSAIGSCHICTLRPAVWSDPVSHTHLCD